MSEARGDAGALQAFAFDGAEVRVVMRDGEPWWVAGDVASALGFDKANRVLRLLDEDEKGFTKVALEVGHSGGPIAIISEPGLYTAITASKKPEAKRFKRWVTHEVLPAIRKTGTYSMAPAQALPDLDGADEATVLAFADVANKLAQASARMVVEYREISEGASGDFGSRRSRTGSPYSGSAIQRGTSEI